MTSKLTIESTNPDWCGVWHKADVEEELRELDIDIDSDHFWIGYVIDHALDDDFGKTVNELLVAVTQNEALHKITIKPEGFDEFTIIKE